MRWANLVPQVVRIEAQSHYCPLTAPAVGSLGEPMSVGGETPEKLGEEEEAAPCQLIQVRLLVCVGDTMYAYD